MGRKKTDNHLRLRLAAHVRHLLDKEGTSQNAFAKRLGYNAGAISKIKAGETSSGVGLDLVVRMRRVLGVSYETLLETDPPPRYFEPSYSKDEQAKVALRETAASLREVLRDSDLDAKSRARLKHVFDHLRQVITKTDDEPA